MKTDAVNISRRRFLSGVTTLVGGVGAAFVAAPFVGSWFPSARAVSAGAPVEVDLSQLEPGAQLTIPWRGKPIIVVRRTERMLASLNDLALSLRDPNSTDVNQQPSYAQNLYRSLKPEFLVVEGLCTHLGCVPVYRPEVGVLEPGWEGGFFCPCHGSKYDLAGRVYKGVPAPSNLPVPPYRFTSENKILIGEDPTV